MSIKSAKVKVLDNFFSAPILLNINLSNSKIAIAQALSLLQYLMVSFSK
jgi:hypothetical protein